jgi:hypothetical protein
MSKGWVYHFDRYSSQFSVWLPAENKELIHCAFPQIRDQRAPFMRYMYGLRTTFAAIPWERRGSHLVSPWEKPAGLAHFPDCSMWYDCMFYISYSLIDLWISRFKPGKPMLLAFPSRRFHPQFMTDRNKAKRNYVLRSRRFCSRTAGCQHQLLACAFPKVNCHVIEQRWKGI